jgi:hypothetical protein
MNLLAAAAVSAIVSAAVSYWMGGSARGDSGRKQPSHDDQSSRRSAHRRVWDGSLEDEWIDLQKRMLMVGRSIVAGAMEEIHSHLAEVEERPVTRTETPQPRLAQPSVTSHAGPPRERDDESKARALFLYREWCTQGRKPKDSDEMRIVPLRHELLRADGATGQPGHHFHDAQQMDAFVRFSAREDTGWIFPHPEARHMPEVVRWIFPALTDNQLASRAALATTEPVAIVRRRDHWELR